MGPFVTCFVGLAVFCALLLIVLGIAWLNRARVIEHGQERIDTLAPYTYTTRGAGGKGTNHG